MPDTWDVMDHWNIVLPPSRPSAWYLSRIVECAQNIDHRAPVAVLGSTPEFRDLLHEQGFDSIYVFDRNVSFYERMCRARIYNNAERFVEGDWFQTLPRCENQFHLMLSDLTSGNVDYADRSKFYSLITKALCPGGVFCDKVLAHKIPHLSVDALARKYARLPLNLLYANFFSCEMLFCSDLLDIKQLVDTGLFYAILEERVTNRRVRAFVNYAKEITPPDCIWYYGRTWSKLQGDYCPDLELLSEADDEVWSSYRGRLSYFTLRKSADRQGL